MISHAAARRYASAIFSLATDAGRVDAVGESLRAVRDAIYSTDAVRRTFVSPVVDRGEKRTMLAAALDGKVDGIVENAVLLLVRKRREALLPDIVGAYDALALAAAGKERLDIVSSQALTAEQVGAIVARLGRSYGKTFDVTQRVDPALLGGVRLTVGDRRVDGTVAGRLDEIARAMKTDGSFV